MINEVVRFDRGNRQDDLINNSPAVAIPTVKRPHIETIDLTLSPEKHK